MVVLTQMATWNWSNANAVLRYVRDKAIFACASNTDSIWRPILIEMFHWLSCISGTLNQINLHSRYLKLNHQLYCIMKLRIKLVPRVMVDGKYMLFDFHRKRSSIMFPKRLCLIWKNECIKTNGLHDPICIFWWLKNWL